MPKLDGMTAHSIHLRSECYGVMESPGLLSHSGRDRTRTPWPRNAKESAVGLLPGTVQLTLAKTACANKVADFIVPFMKKLASHTETNVLGSMTRSARTHRRSGQNLHSGKKSHKNVAWMFCAHG